MSNSRLISTLCFRLVFGAEEVQQGLDRLKVSRGTSTNKVIQSAWPRSTGRQFQGLQGLAVFGFPGDEDGLGIDVAPQIEWFSPIVAQRTDQFDPGLKWVAEPDFMLFVGFQVTWALSTICRVSVPSGPFTQKGPPPGSPDFSPRRRPAAGGLIFSRGILPRFSDGHFQKPSGSEMDRVCRRKSRTASCPLLFPGFFLSISRCRYTAAGPGSGIPLKIFFHSMVTPFK